MCSRQERELSSIQEFLGGDVDLAGLPYLLARRKLMKCDDLLSSEGHEHRQYNGEQQYIVTIGV